MICTQLRRVLLGKVYLIFIYSRQNCFSQEYIHENIYFNKFRLFISDIQSLTEAREAYLILQNQLKKGIIHEIFLENT